MKRKSFRRALGAEGLEERQMMAGDVTTAVSGQILMLAGDGLDNGIIITGLAGQIQVTGFEQDGTDTTVNGNHRATFENIRKIVVDLGLGDDALVVTDLNLAGRLVSRAPVGAGGIPGLTSVTNANPVSVALAIQMGDGDDIVGLGQFDNLTGEIDPLTLLPEYLLDETINARLKPLSVSRDVAIDLGDGENILRATAVTVGGALSIAMGDDDDELRLESRGTLGATGFLPGVTVGLNSAIVTGDGEDEIRIDRFSTRNLAFSSGAGNDVVRLANVSVTQDTAISGGDGFDAITLDGYSTRRLKLAADAGDDDVSVRNVRTTSTTTIDGGSGDNIYFDLGGNRFARSLRLLNFDTVIGSNVVAKTISRAPVA